MKLEKSQDKSLVDMLQWNSIERMISSVDRLSRSIYVISILLGLNLVLEVIYIIARTGLLLNY